MASYVVDKVSETLTLSFAKRWVKPNTLNVIFAISFLDLMFSIDPILHELLGQRILHEGVGKQKC